jgi:hypothetical protein
LNVATIIAIAEAAAQLVKIVQQNVETGKATMSAKDLATLQGVLAPIHEQNAQLANTLDAALADAAKRS